MEVVKNELIEALEIVKPALASKEIIEQSNSFAFFGDRVVTYNDEISISHPVKSLNLNGAVRAQELYDLLNKIKTENVSLVQSENQLKLNSKTTKAGLSLQSEITLPIKEIDGIKDWEDLPADFSDDLNFVKDFAGNDKSQMKLTCVHVGQHIIQASDGIQLMRVFIQSDAEFPFSDILIPARLVGEIHKIEPTQIAKDTGWIHFKNSTGTTISCRILEDDYPDTSEHFEVDGESAIFPKDMAEIIDRVKVIAKKDHFMDEEMEITLDGSKMLVSGSNEGAWIKEKARVKYKGVKIRFSITPYILQSILKKSSKCLIGDTKIKFSGDGWEYVAMLRH